MACHCHRFMSSNHKSDASHHLKTYREYNDLTLRKQIDYILDYFRGEVGFALLHVMFKAQPDDFNGEIDLHNDNVKTILKRFGIDKDLKEKRDIDLFNFILNTYANTESYLAKKARPAPHHFTSEELLGIRIWEGKLVTEDDLNALEEEIEKLKYKKHF